MYMKGVSRDGFIKVFEHVDCHHRLRIFFLENYRILYTSPIGSNFSKNEDKFEKWMARLITA